MDPNLVLRIIELSLEIALLNVQAQTPEQRATAETRWLNFIEPFGKIADALHAKLVTP